MSHDDDHDDKHSWWCRLHRNCDQPTSTTTNVVELLRQRTIMDANHRGGWTQRFQTEKVTFKVIKVTRIGAIWEATYDFLLVFNCKHCVHLAPFRDITTYFPKFKEVWPRQLGVVCHRKANTGYILYLHTKFGDSRFSRYRDMIASKLKMGHVTLTTPL